MSIQRVLCPTSATWHDRHYVTDRRWTLTSPEGATTTLCGAACALSWLCSVLPAAIAAGAQTSAKTVGEVAA